MVGKWHLGFYEWEYTPTYRGFDSHYGFYTGCGDHYTHERLGILDLRDNKSPVRDMNGTYSANLFTRVRKIVNQTKCFRLTCKGVSYEILRGNCSFFLWCVGSRHVIFHLIHSKHRRLLRTTILQYLSSFTCLFKMSTSQCKLHKNMLTSTAS